ncbi:hypothetical protein AAFF_G00090790 [Aldrovandia affinis]|uniref:Uncharacterized protein n=1 Tax=Aldrovandia affinis TaxID=143900 RepID=A0AAD7RW01_9TELE|nr:hypothetical protein AAFF_G00090790 [Aldrovandia affinis]
MFKTINNSLDDYADAVTSYISFCEETCIPTRAVYTFNNCKPWFSAELGKLRTNKEEAYRSGDQDGYKRAKYALNKAVKTAKRRYKDKLDQPVVKQGPRRSLALFDLAVEEEDESLPLSNSFTALEALDTTLP